MLGSSVLSFGGRISPFLPWKNICLKNKPHTHTHKAQNTKQKGKTKQNKKQKTKNQKIGFFLFISMQVNYCSHKKKAGCRISPSFQLSWSLSSLKPVSQVNNRSKWWNYFFSTNSGYTSFLVHLILGLWRAGATNTHLT